MSCKKIISWSIQASLCLSILACSSNCGKHTSSGVRDPVPARTSNSSDNSKVPSSITSNASVPGGSSVVVGTGSGSNSKVPSTSNTNAVGANSNSKCSSSDNPSIIAPGTEKKNTNHHEGSNGIGNDNHVKTDESGQKDLTSVQVEEHHDENQTTGRISKEDPAKSRDQYFFDALQNFEEKKENDYENEVFFDVEDQSKADLRQAEEAGNPEKNVQTKVKAPEKFMDWVVQFFKDTYNQLSTLL